MLYSALLRNHLRRVSRSYEGKRLWLIGLGLVPVATYGVMVLVGLGIFFGRLLRPGEGGAVGLLNSHLITAFSGMLVLRFFFQRPPRMEITPYLHLPMPRRALVRYFQVASLASLHNLYPLLFFVPFWITHMLPNASRGAVLWLCGVVLLLILSHYLNTMLRVAVDRHGRLMLWLAAFATGLSLLDQAAGAQLSGQLSVAFFGALAAGDGLVLALLLTLTLAAVVASTHTLHWSLRTGPGTSAQRRRVLPPAGGFGTSAVGNLILLELLMMWRSKRTRQYVLISVGVSTVYTALLLSDYNAYFGNLMAAAVGLFASGVFALNYGQLMFAWESHYFDGLLARSISAQQLVLAKYMLLQGSCLLLFLISLPLFFWLAPHMLMLHVAFLFYNAGVTSLLMLSLAVFNRRRVHAGEGSFFNYQGFSFLHWLWIIPTIIPPTLLFYALESSPETALSLVALLGLVCMLGAWPASVLLARILTHRKYLMAAGFRSYDR